MFVVALLCLAYFLSVASNSIPDVIVELLSPQEGNVFYSTEDLFLLQVKYLVSPKTIKLFSGVGEVDESVSLINALNEYEICLQVQPYVDNASSCQLMKSLEGTIDLYLPPSSYKINAIIKSQRNTIEPLVSSSIVNFIIVGSGQVPEFLPKMRLISNNDKLIKVTANDITKTKDVKVVFQLESSLPSFEIEKYFNSIDLLDDRTNNIIFSLTKLDSYGKVRSFDISGLPIGEYRVVLKLFDTHNHNKVDELRIGIHVLALEDNLPSIQIIDTSNDQSHRIHHFEYGVKDSNSHYQEDIIVRYQVHGEISALRQLKTCLRVYQRSNHQADLLLADNICNPNTPDGTHEIQSEIVSATSSFVLRDLYVGEFYGVIYFMTNVPSTSLSSSSSREIRITEKTSQEFIIEIRVTEEFIPSYHWQDLRGWQTIPAGLEVILPIDGSHHRRARIPPEWRLQLSMPSPCKYFLRMNIRRETTLQDIKNAASTACKRYADISSECFILHLGENASHQFPSTSTAEQTNLYNVEKHLQINPSCLS